MIRPLELTKASDVLYLAFLTINQVNVNKAVKLNIYFDNNNILKVNFKINSYKIVAKDN